MKTLSQSLSADQLTKAMARRQFSQLSDGVYKVKELDESFWGQLPDNKYQITVPVLKRMVKFFLKQQKPKFVRDCRRMYGFMVLAELHTTF